MGSSISDTLHMRQHSLSKWELSSRQHVDQIGVVVDFTGNRQFLLGTSLGTDIFCLFIVWPQKHEGNTAPLIQNSNTIKNLLRHHDKVNDTQAMQWLGTESIS